MKKSFRVLSFMLVVLLVGTMLGACGSKENVVEQTPSTTSGTSEATTKEIPTIKLKYLTHGVPNLVDKPKYGDEALAAVNEKLSKDLGFMVEPEYVSYADDVFEEKLNLDLASGNDYDMIRAVPKSASDLFNKGMLMDLTDVINTSAVNYKKNIPENVWNEVMVGGKIYGLPSTGFNTVMGAWVRGEWLDKAGLALPTNLSEFENVMKSFRDGDFDGNKKADTIPYVVQIDNAEMILLGLFTENPGDYLDSNGKITPKYFDPGYKQFVELLKKWYAEKYVDDQLFKGDDNSISDLYSQNKTGIAGLNVWHLEWGPINAVDKNRPEVKTMFMKQFDSEMKKYQSQGLVSSLLAASATSKNYEYAVKFVDWYMFNEENYYLVNKGIKGKSYDVVDNAVIIPSTETAKTQLELIGLIGPETSSGMEFKYYPAATPPESKKAYDYAVKEVDLAKVFVPITKFITPEIPDDIKIKKDESDKMAKEFISNIIKGKKDISTYDEMLKKYDDMGGMQYYQVLTDAYAKTK